MSASPKLLSSPETPSTAQCPICVYTFILFAAVASYFFTAALYLVALTTSSTKKSFNTPLRRTIFYMISVPLLLRTILFINFLFNTAVLSMVSTLFTSVQCTSSAGCAGPRGENDRAICAFISEFCLLLYVLFLSYVLWRVERYLF